VTNENAQNYIELIIHSLFNHSIRAQLKAFKSGFEKFMQIRMVESFATSSEIETLVCGIKSGNANNE